MKNPIVTIELRQLVKTFGACRLEVVKEWPLDNPRVPLIWFEDAVAVHPNDYFELVRVTKQEDLLASVPSKP